MKIVKVKDVEEKCFIPGPKSATAWALDKGRKKKTSYKERYFGTVMSGQHGAGRQKKTLRSDRHECPKHFTPRDEVLDSRGPRRIPLFLDALILKDYGTTVLRKVRNHKHSDTASSQKTWTLHFLPLSNQFLSYPTNQCYITYTVWTPSVNAPKLIYLSVVYRVIQVKSKLPVLLVCSHGISTDQLLKKINF
jgi:hypothetical protein